MAVIPVQRKALTLAERTYIPQIAGGLMTTLRYFFEPTETLQYPEQRPAIPPGYRGVPTLVMDPHGREKCVSCQLCEFVCPPKAIRITPGSVPRARGSTMSRRAAGLRHRHAAVHLLRAVRGGLPGGGDLPAEAVLDVGLQPSGDGEPQGQALRAGGDAPGQALQVGQEEGRRGGGGSRH